MQTNSPAAITPGQLLHAWAGSAHSREGRPEQGARQSLRKEDGFGVGKKSASVLGKTIYVDASGLQFKIFKDARVAE